MNENSASKIISAEVTEELSGKRLDGAAASLFSDYSRSRIQAWIKDQRLQVNGEVQDQRYKVQEGDELVLAVVQDVVVEAQPCAIDLDIVFEDDDLLVINKPAGLVVHPGAGNPTGTLMNGLLHYLPELNSLPRAGIVHRLDKDTTGLMVVAKSLEAHTDLVQQLQEKTVLREYWAVVQGVMTGGGKVDANIGRHPKQRVKMAVTQRDGAGKTAVTHYRIEKKFAAHTLVKCMLETGRTHQIRVHMAHIRYPLVGDRLYAGRMKIPAGASQRLKDHLQNFSRQALHAKTLGLIHPITGDTLEWTADLPDDFKSLLKTLEQEEQLL